jgi:predicted Rdx family selenoprotein
LGAEITRAFPKAKIELQPGGRGDFIVTIDGKQVWNKRRHNDEFPETSDILGALKK